MSCMILVGKDAFKENISKILYVTYIKFEIFDKNWVKNGFFQSTFDVSGIISCITCDGRMV